MGILDRFLEPRQVRARFSTLRTPSNDPFVRRDEVFHRDEYMDKAAEMDWLSAGLADSELIHERGRLVVTTPFGLLNPRSVHAYKIGLFSFQIRGTYHYPGSVKGGDFSPGAEAILRREPSNPYDANAIAVYAGNATKRAGYVNKQRAGRLAPIIDSGVDIAAISLRGDGIGQESVVPTILACERATLDYLRRRLR